MGFWDFLRRGNQPVTFMQPNRTMIGGDELSSFVLTDFTPAQMWATQPHLRIVITFLARNIAQLGLHSFQRDGDDRQRDRTSPFARVMQRPNADQTAYELIYSLVGDLALYDRAYWLIVEDVEAPSGWTIRRLPPAWVTPIARDVFGAKGYSIRAQSGETVEVSADQVLAFGGYHPTNPRIGSPTVEALKDTLQEQIEAGKYRNQVWKRGGRVSAVIKRPAGATWSDAARTQFREDWYSKYSGDGNLTGGTPILEDGMELQKMDFSASEQQFVEAAKLSFNTVCSAFHVNPTMVGLLDNANYSNVREFRRMLYGDTLGPLIAQIEDRINAFMLPRLGMDNELMYVEFNIGEKLQGSFEEQAGVMQTLVGAPLMTRNEGRAKFNLPAIAGGDTLVTPLNVLIGGQASPTDSAPPKSVTGHRVKALKAAANDNHAAKINEVLNAFFARQGKSVLSLVGAGRDWWDEERWNKELADDLHATLHTLADVLGKAEAERLGYSDGYDPDRTVAFLKAVAERKAAGINETTHDQLKAAIDDGGQPADVFDLATTSRAEGIAAGLAVFAAGFATLEAGRQIGHDHGVEPTKTWITGANPRPSHAAVDGETVGINDTFSNGMDWPGDGGPDDCGCNCAVQIDIP